MLISSILELTKGSVVSIVGAGGKTTLMFNIAKELRPCNKVLLTTTTKIYKPEKSSYDFICIGEENCSMYDTLKVNGLYVYGKLINHDNKLIGLTKEFLYDKFNYFDYSLIEADGSKRKPIKGWQENEPVICENTTNTIGVLDITCINKIINDVNVHRVNHFIKITNGNVNEKISIQMISSLITHPLGLFKSSKGEKILFINKVEDKYTMLIAYKLIHNLLKTSNLSIHKIVIGSLKENKYNSICL
ncbi:selenium cofactor biosynthesis protein YqeC [Clostridium sp. Marseille-Q2269]|uniref:selenium cofactor biosynthesis protein YqeC n=1 Tax=Clostridium sp. Marseille-Q2269 TaxID=2942205 RepID=UPI0020730A35|nr:selenium cofactor biosynthesis protein YqeC [Clostridium sp. Marseille-Q2269]